MRKPYPQNPFLRGNFAPFLMEGDALDLIVEGEIPAELRGGYYRNGANPQFAPAASYHWFEGDGMIHGFLFEDGRCDYRNRWVRTARFELEREHGRSLFGGLGSSVADPAAEAASGNTANTNVVWHAGKLLALWEAGPPTELDPVTLETIGVWDDGGAFRRERYGVVAPDVMTAHPKLDPDTGEWLAFGYSPMKPWLVYHELDANGHLQRSDEIEAPFPSMMHDFVTTSDHVVFGHHPAVFDFEAMEKTGSMLSWQPDRGSQIAVMPRRGDDPKTVWVDKEAGYVFHYVNAWTEGSVVKADVFHLDRIALGLGGEPPASAPTLHRWTIDLEAGTLRDEALDDAPAEFGRVDPRYVGKAYRHAWTLGSQGIPRSAGEPSNFNCLFHYDHATGARTEHRLPTGDSFGEPQFVPRSQDAAEGDGFVLSIVYRAAENRSDLLVLDAQDFGAAPLATIQCPHRIPFGFHGNWRPAA
jgi:carotenoid cleavage dioxygenase